MHFHASFLIKHALYDGIHHLHTCSTKLLIGKWKKKFNEPTANGLNQQKRIINIDFKATIWLGIWSNTYKNIALHKKIS